MEKLSPITAFQYSMDGSEVQTPVWTEELRDGACIKKALNLDTNTEENAMDLCHSCVNLMVIINLLNHVIISWRLMEVR